MKAYFWRLAARLAFLPRKMKVSWSWKLSQTMARQQTNQKQEQMQRLMKEIAFIFSFFRSYLLDLDHWSIIEAVWNEREGFSTAMKHSMASILRRCQELSYELNTAEQLLFTRRETLFLHEPRCGLEVHWKFLNEEIGTSELILNTSC